MGTVPISRASPIEQIAAAALSMRGFKVSPFVYRRSPGDRDGIGIVLKPHPCRDGSSWAVVAAEEGRDSARAGRRARSLADGFRAEYRAAASARARCGRGSRRGDSGSRSTGSGRSCESWGYAAPRRTPAR